MVRRHDLYHSCYTDSITSMDFSLAPLVILLNTCQWLWLDSVQELLFWSVFLFSKEIKYSEVNQGPGVLFYMSQGHVSWADDRVANGDKVVRGCTNPWYEGYGGAANKAEPMLSAWANAFEKNPLNRLIPLFPTWTWLTLFCVHPGCFGADPGSFAFLTATGPDTLPTYLWKYSLGSAEQSEITHAALCLCYCLLTLSPMCSCC